MSTRRDFLNMVMTAIPRVSQVFEKEKMLYFVVEDTDKDLWHERCADIFAALDAWRSEHGVQGYNVTITSAVSRLPICERIWARDPLLWGLQLDASDIAFIKSTAKQEMHLAVSEMQTKMRELEKRFLGAQMPEEAEILSNANKMLQELRGYLQ